MAFIIVNFLVTFFFTQSSFVVVNYLIEARHTLTMLVIEHSLLLYSGKEAGSCVPPVARFEVNQECVYMGSLFHCTVVCAHLGNGTGHRTVTMAAPLLLNSGPVRYEVVLQL